MATIPKRLTDKAKPWVVQALKEDHNRNDEPVIWELGLSAFPDLASTASQIVEDSDDSSALVPVPSLVLYLEIPDVDPKGALYLATVLSPYLLNRDSVKQAVFDGLQSLRDTRAQRKVVAENSSSNQE